MNKKSKNVLILAPYFLPGYKAGGPIRSIVNLIEQTNDRFNYYVITRNKDFGCKKKYPNININEWKKLDNYQVLYRKSKLIDFQILSSKSIYYSNTDFIYLNSFFDLNYSIIPVISFMLRRIKNAQLIIAPRGEFSENALNIKSFKKKIFFSIFKRFYTKNIVWHSSSDNETVDIRKMFGVNARIFKAPNFSNSNINYKPTKDSKSIKDGLRIIFLSRISKMKNLSFAFECLSQVHSNIVFHIYGPYEDLEYSEHCKRLGESLPGNIQFEFFGEIPHEQINDTLNLYDLFFLPTLGENYGHSIVESLKTGCPVLISDMTPWNDVEINNAGWAYPLNSLYPFAKKIDQLAQMNTKEYSTFQKGALRYGKFISDKNQIIAQYEQLFSSKT